MVRLYGVQVRSFRKGCLSLSTNQPCGLERADLRKLEQIVDFRLVGRNRSNESRNVSVYAVSDSVEKKRGQGISLAPLLVSDRVGSDYIPDPGP